MDTQKVLGGRCCQVNFAFQDIVDGLQAECFTEDIFEGNDNTKAF